MTKTDEEVEEEYKCGGSEVGRGTSRAKHWDANFVRKGHSDYNQDSPSVLFRIMLPHQGVSRYHVVVPSTRCIDTIILQYPPAPPLLPPVNSIFVLWIFTTNVPLTPLLFYYRLFETKSRLSCLTMSLSPQTGETLSLLPKPSERSHTRTSKL